MNPILIIDILICLLVLVIVGILVWAALCVSSPAIINPYTYHGNLHRTDNRTGRRQHWENGAWIDSDKQAP